MSPDVLQTWLYHSNVAGCLAAGRAGIEPVLTGVRVAERRGRVRLWIERFCTRRARRHVCVSQDVAVFCQTHVGLDPRKIEVIVNGVEPERFQRVQPRDLSELGIDAEDLVIAWIGRLDPQKDPLLAIEAFGRLDASFSDCHLVMAGEGPLQGRIESTCARAGLVGRVHLLGRVPDVPQLLARSCGMLLTSRWEGMPNVVLEAMAAGRPVVARLSEGVGDLVEDGVTGWVVSDNQVSSLASAIEQLLSDPGLGFEMGERGCQKVTEDYSIEKMVQQYDAMWEREILESRR
ncbi:MAG: glycosyltransferase [Planctomycetota bacterium]|nr:glycosyltransferase [Planctomycetota bacterium]